MSALFIAIGVTLLTSPAYAANFNVASDSELRSAISTAVNGDTITFTANITLGSNLPNVTTNVTFIGGNHTLSGNNQYRGLFVQSGTVAINDLTITNALAQGGTGGYGFLGGGGGGGAGLGGALFIASGAHVAVDNVNLQISAARGGEGGSGASGGVVATSGGGGGYWPTGANGGNANGFVSGGGGTGGGGDGTANGNGVSGGFGGGGGGSGSAYGGVGGFGGGGGGGAGATMIDGGFLAGKGGAGGATGGGGGGGGAGMGGAIFVQGGGTIAVNGPLNVSGNAVSGGKGASGFGFGGAGGSAGAGMFLAGNGSLAIAPAGGETTSISDAIVDQTGLGGTGANAGSWSLVKNGAGTLILTGANKYSGGTTVNSGVLQGDSLGIQGNILNNAQVVFNQSTGGTYAGNMSGTGTLVKTGVGNLTLDGTNTQAGGIRVENGVLFFRNDASLGPTGMGIDLSGGAIGIGTANGQVMNRDLALTGTGGIYVGPNGGNPNAQVTWNGAITGAGALIVAGDGILELTGNNTYAGGTRVSGDLRFTTDANLGATGTGIALNGGTLGTTADAAAALNISRDLTLTDAGTIYVQNNPLIWSGDISGTGRFLKNGGGVLQLTGTNTYSGDTIIEEGTLQIASDDKLGSGTNIMMVNNGHLWATSSFTTSRSISLVDAGGGFQLDAGTTLTLTGTIGSGGTGARTLSLVGTGTLVLAAAADADAYGGVNNYGGTIQGNTSNLLGNIAFDNNAGNTNARSIVFDQATDGTFAGNITGMGNTLGLGTVTKTGAGKLVLSGTSKFKSQVPGLAEFTVLGGTLQGTSASLLGNIVNNAALIFDQTFDGTYAGSMSGTGTLTKNGTGKVNLTGVSTVGGGTTINAGGVAVNGHLNSNVLVNKGGTLSGSGNVTGDITNNGGTVKPGNSIGHLTVDGNFTFNSGTLEMEVNAAGDSDRISVIGADHRVMINAGTLDIVTDPGIYRPGTTYTIITTEGGGNVTFGEVTGGVGFLTPEVSLDSEHIYVTLALAPDAFASAALTANQRAVGGALDAIAASGNVGGLVTTIANLPVADGAAAFQTLSGQPYADLATVNLRASQLFMNAVGRQMSVARNGGSGGDRVSLMEPGSDTLADFSVWMSGIGSTGSVNGDANASGLDYTLGGTAFGIDYRVNPSFLVGVAGGYVSGSQSVNGFAGDTDADTVSAVAYGSFTQGPLYVDALAGYANASNSMERSIGSAGLPFGRAEGDTDAGQFLGQIETGYRFDLATPFSTAITPFARLQVVAIDQDGFTETGLSPYNLTVASQSTTSVRTTIGADFTASFDLGNGMPLDLGLRLGWVHEFADTTPAMTASFASAPGADFTVYGATRQRDSALIGLSAAVKLSDSSSLFASYDGELGGGNDNHQLWGGFKLTW